MDFFAARRNVSRFPLFGCRRFAASAHEMSNRKTTPGDASRGTDSAARKKKTTAVETPAQQEKPQQSENQQEPQHEQTDNGPTEATSQKRRIFILDDHPLFRLGIKQLIGGEQDLFVCGEASNAIEAFNSVLRLKPELITADISLAESANGIEFIKNIKAHLPRVRILVISMYDELLYAMRALRAGAHGYIMKSEALDHVIEAIRIVLSGKVYTSPGFNDHLISQLVQGEQSSAESPVEQLTDRELEVLHLIGLGHGTRQIAEELRLSPKTVETHRMKIREKLDVQSSTELVRFAVQWVEQQKG